MVRGPREGVFLIRSPSRPGGNTTGISILATELDGKRQELLIELVPAARRMADPGDTAPEQLRALEDAAQVRGLELSTHIASTPEEIVPAIDAAKASGAQALNVLASGSFNLNQRLIIERTGMLQLPAIYQWPEIAEAGGLRPAICGGLPATGRTTARQDFPGSQAR